MTTPTLQTFDAQGWRGLQLQSTLARDESFVSDVQNLVPLDPVNGGPFIRRFGLHKTANVFAGSAGVVQWLGTFDLLAGPLAVAVVSGEVWTWAGNTTAWTRQLTAAQITAAGITLSPVTPCFAVTFANVLVVHDGVHRPFTWDGSTGAGLVNLTNAPATVYGKPAVYYGKLFFIKGSARSTIVWSEENQPNVGYEATVGGVTYSNVWNLWQSGSSPLVALLGTNNALYYFRQRGIGAIRGAVNATFVAAGTHDNISSTTGVGFQRGVSYIDGVIFFLDPRGRPWAVTEGGGKPTPIWRDLSDIFVLKGQQLGGGLAPYKTAVISIPEYDAVLFFYGESHSGYLFSVATLRCLAKWTTPNAGPGIPYAADVVDADLTILSLGVLAPTPDLSQVHWFVGPQYGGTGYYQADEGTDSPFVLQLDAIGDQSGDLTWYPQQQTFELLLGSDVTTCTATVALTPAATPGLHQFGAMATVGAPTVSNDADVGTIAQRRLVVGLTGEYRWFQPTLTITGVGASFFGVERATTIAEAVPSVPART